MPDQERRQNDSIILSKLSDMEGAYRRLDERVDGFIARYDLELADRIESRRQEIAELKQLGERVDHLEKNGFRVREKNSATTGIF